MQPLTQFTIQLRWHGTLRAFGIATELDINPTRN
jgi:hypothetical protein